MIKQIPCLFFVFFVTALVDQAMCVDVKEVFCSDATSSGVAVNGKATAGTVAVQDAQEISYSTAWQSLLAEADARIRIGVRRADGTGGTTVLLDRGGPCAGTAAWDVAGLSDGRYVLTYEVLDGKGATVQTTTANLILARNAVGGCVVSGLSVNAKVGTQTLFAHDVEQLAYSTRWQSLVPAEQANVKVSAQRTNDTAAVLCAVAGSCAGIRDWNTKELGPGRYTLRHEVSDSTGTVVDTISAQFLLFGGEVALHGGTLATNETWSADVVHVVTETVIVPSGMTLTIESKTIVKFCSGTGIQVLAGGALGANGACFSHFADDSLGGDTNMDGSESKPSSNAYSIGGAGTLIMDSSTELHYTTQQTSGTISGSTTWLPGRTYCITNDITVASGGALTIPAGTILKFSAGKSLIVDSGGTLNAIGTRAQPIIFTSYRDDTYGGDTNGDGSGSAPNPGDWGMVKLGGGAGDFAYCTFQYGGGVNGNQYGARANVFCWDNGQGVFKGCTFASSPMDGCFAQNCTFENCLFIDNDRGFASQAGNVTAINCVFAYNRIGFFNHGSALTVKNSISAFNTGSGASRDGGSQTVQSCCCWNPDASSGNLDGVTADKSIEGNPLFADAEAWDFRIQSGSPCIDAGDGTVAPVADYFGQPRMDVHSVADTGVATTNRVCPDIGIYEYPGVYSGHAPDLKVTDVQAPEFATVGDQIDVHWHVANIRNMSAGGSWRDKVSLISEDGLNNVELGTVVSSGTFAPGATNAFAAWFFVPPSVEGVWRVRVQSNAYRDIYEGTNTANNVRTADAATTVSVPESDPAAGISGSAQSGKPYVTSVTFDGAHSMVGRIQASAGTVIYYGAGFMPTTSAYSGKAVCDGSGGVIGIPATGQRVYVLVVSELASESAFTLTFESCELVIKSVSPNTVPHNGTTGLTLTGANFSDGCAVTFVNGEQTVAATNVTVLSGEKMTAEVDCGRFTAGVRYASRVTSVTNVAELADALAVQAATGEAKLECSLTVPDSVREGRTILLYINYENTGNIDMAAPVFTVKADGLDFTVDGNSYSNSVKVMGLNAETPFGVLRPHAPQRLAVQAQIRPGTHSISYRLFAAHNGAAGSDEPLRLDGFFNETWVYYHDESDDALLAALSAKLGTTWGEFYDRLAAYAGAVATSYGAVHDYETLSRQFASGVYQEVNLELSEADGADHVSAAEERGVQASARTAETTVVETESAAFSGALVSIPALESENSPLWDVPVDQSVLRFRTENHHTLLTNDNSLSGDIWVYRDGWWYNLTNNIGNGLVNVSQQSVLICHGNLHSIHSPWVKKMAEAWKAAEPDSNIMAVDWGDDATAMDDSIKPWNDPGVLREHAKCPEFAKATAKDIPNVARAAFVKLTSSGISGPKLTLIGHSHGGHVAGDIAGQFGYVKRLIGLETSNIDSHSMVDSGSKFPKAWSSSNAGQCEFYKTSYWMSMGSSISKYIAWKTENDDAINVFGDFNFHVVASGDKLISYPMLSNPVDPTSSANTPEGRLLSTRHDYVQKWFTETIIQRNGTWKDVGYGWNVEQWKTFAHESIWPPANRYHGVINAGTGRIECARPEGVKTNDWRYDEVVLRIGDGSVGSKCRHDKLQENMAQAIEYEVVIENSPATFRTGTRQAVNVEVRNNLDNHSIPYDELDKDLLINLPWRDDLADGVWLFDLKGLPNTFVWDNISSLKSNAVGRIHRLHGWSRWSLGHFIRPGESADEEWGIVIPSELFGRTIGGNGEDDDGEDFVLIFAAGVSLPLFTPPPENQFPVSYAGELYENNNYAVKKIKVVNGDRPVARIKVNNAWLVENGETAPPIYADKTTGRAMVSLNGYVSAEGKYEIGEYTWTDEHGATFSTSGQASLTVTLPVGVNAMKVGVGLRIKDTNGNYDATVCVLDIRRKGGGDEGNGHGGGGSSVPQSCDPNEVSGPLGFGDPDTQRYVVPGQWMEYTVYFENLSNALASAQEVWVTDLLSPSLDWSAFEMEEVVFNNQLDNGLAGKKGGRSEATLSGTDYSVRTELSVDQETGIASWYLRIVDPGSVDSWPSDPSAGLLPPNDDTHRGEGHVSYRVKVREDAGGYSVISNAATIVFDYNTPITTDPSWWNMVFVDDSTRFDTDSCTLGEGDGNAVLTVNGGNATNVSSVAYWVLPGTAAAGTDYEAPAKQPQRIAWTNEVGEKRITIPIKADTAVEGAEAFYVLLGSPTNCAVGEPKVCKVTITDANSGLTLAEALDNALLKWTTGGAAAWLPQTSVTYDGVDAAASGSVASNKLSYAQTSVKGTGTLSYAWSVVGRGVLRLYDGKVVLAAVTNATAWETRSLTLSQNAAHTLKWEFTNLGGTNSFGYLDQVVWLPGGKAGVTVTATASPAEGGAATGSGMYYTGAKVSLAATAKPGWLFAGWTPTNLFAKPMTAAQTVTVGGSPVSAVANFTKVPVVIGLPNPPEGGTVTGSGLCPPGKSVTLKAAPTAKWAFTSWSDGSQAATRAVASTTNMTLYASFKPTSAITAPTVADPGAQSAMVGVLFNLALNVESECLPTVKVSGLPKGLAFNASNLTISGVPSSAVPVGGFSTATVSASNPGGNGATVAFAITVSPLDARAQGTFTGVASDDDAGDNAVRGLLSATVTPQGAFSAKSVMQSGAVRFTGKSWDSASNGVFRATLKTTKGETLSLAQDTASAWNMVGLTGALTGGAFSNSVLSVSGQRGPMSAKTAADYAAGTNVLTRYKGYYTVALPPDDVLEAPGAAGNVPLGSGYLTLTVKDGGAVALVGKLADGTALSGASALIAVADSKAGEAAYVPFLFPLYGAKGVFSGVLEILPGELVGDNVARPCDNFAQAWSYPGKAPASKPTQTEDRFMLSLGMSGGWYNSLTDLRAHYSNAVFSAASSDVTNVYVSGVYTAAVGVVDAALPEVPLAINPATGLISLSSGKAPVYNPATGAYAYAPTNPAVATFKLTKATGIFSGTFNLYYEYRDQTGALKLKTVSVAHAGVLTPVSAEPGTEPAGQGFYLVPDTWKSSDAKPVVYPIKRSYGVEILDGE